ncbi:energy transducer TonB [Zoogloea sp. LCSB751]|uniref:energy transducer TonB n=1 Tax=Zoogloea sp. LCSB751 TaxID=1965277 RepID=UPI0009A4B3BE|nr:energy transducer TonB [Zoogloea sp. LCSB751]
MSTLPLFPATAWPRPAALPRPLKLAIGLSVGLHLVLLAQRGWTPEHTAALPQPLQVMLRTPQPVPETPPPARPAVVVPVETPPVHRTPQAVAAQAPKPLPILTRPAHPDAPPAPVVRAPEPIVQASTPAAAAPALIADSTPRTPAPAASPAPVAARMDSIPAIVADEPPDPALLERYGRSLSSLFSRHQQYPRLAAMRGWEGEVQLRITIARKGNIVATQVIRSSGFEVLDQNAVQLVTGTGALPRPPEALQNKEIQIVVPVLFKLDKPT